MGSSVTHSSPNKLVYLFELDSVRKSDEECRKGQEALFKELMKGNIVALSYNQVSSLIMIDLLDIWQEKQTKKPILNLCKEGRICVSQYKQLTLIDYITKNLEPNGPFFIFSCLYFLNDLDKEHPIFAYMQGVLHHSLPKLMPKQIEETYGFNKQQSNMIYDYINTMINLTQEIKHIDKADHELKNLYYYIDTVIKAVRDNDSVEIPQDVIQTAIAYLEQSMNCPANQTRSALQKELKSIDNSAIQSVNFARAILDISYNYQVERSIRGITVTHDLKNPQLIAETVYKYYNEHDFEAADRQCTLPKHEKILYWNALSAFCSKISDSDIQSAESWKKHLAKVVVKKIVVTLFVFSLIAAFMIFPDKIKDQFLDPLAAYSKLGVFIFFIVYLMFEVINYNFPTSIIDGWFSIITVARYVITYQNFKAGKCKYIRANLKEIKALKALKKEIGD